MPLSSPAQNSSRRYRPFVGVLACVAAGTVVDRYTAPPMIAWWLAAGFILPAWIATSLLARSTPTRHTAGAILAAIGCAVAGGIRHHAAWYEYSADDVGTYAAIEPRPVRLEGVIVDAPRDTTPPEQAAAFEANSAAAGKTPPPRGAGVLESASAFDPASRRTQRTRFTLAAKQIRNGEKLEQVDGLVDVEVAGRWSEGEAGDYVTIIGQLALRSPPLNPGEFDFAAHYRADRKLCAMRVGSPEALTVVARRRWWNLTAWISGLRRAAHDRVLESLPPDQAGFASALLLGYRDQLDPADNRAFFRTGMVHVLSISGMHVAMLALFLHCGLRVGWVGRRTAAAVIIGVTIAYGLLIDAEPPAVRAVIVVAAVGLATIVGRRSGAINVLAGSALFVLAMNPCDLFRTGPQLSFLAAAVLAWWAERRSRHETDDDAEPQDPPDPLEQLERRSFRRRFLRRLATFGRGLLVSAAILAITTPLVAHRFHVASPISLWLTPLLWIPMTLGLLFGLLTLLAWVIVPPLAAWLGAFSGFWLRVIECSVYWGQDLPTATYWIPGPSLAATIGFYVLIGLWLLPAERSVTRRMIGFATITWGILSLIPSHAMPADCRARCTFIAVDHGLSVLVEHRSDDGAKSIWLYDCGRLGSGEIAARSIAGVLWSRGITRLDGIVISHADADHFNGLPTLLEQFRVRQVVLSHEMARSPNRAPSAIRAMIAAAEIPLTTVSAGETLPWSSPSLECRVLHPPQAGAGGSDNAQSLVVELVTPRSMSSPQSARRILLTGDLEAGGLKTLVAGEPLDCDVLLAPHHGSASSNPEGLTQWSKPEVVVVSGSAGPKSVTRTAYEAGGAKVLETTTDGAITVSIDADGEIDVATFLKQ
jgi:competence protein ComEC